MKGTHTEDRWGRQRPCRLEDLVPPRETTVKEATPEDIKRQAASERKRLANRIKSLQGELEQAKEQLKFWESIPG